VSSRSVRAGAAILALVGSFFVLLMWAFGVATMCTTDENCTLEQCPARCSRPEQVILVTGGVLLLISAVFVFGTWISRRVYVFVATALTLEGAAVTYMLTL
jgi:hypothetical protein